MASKPHEDPACRCEPCVRWFDTKDRRLPLFTLDPGPHLFDRDCMVVATEDDATINERGLERYAPSCPAKLDCGGSCHLPKDHAPPCLCIGDTDGPGSCPA